MVLASTRQPICQWYEIMPNFNLVAMEVCRRSSGTNYLLPAANFVLLPVYVGTPKFQLQPSKLVAPKSLSERLHTRSDWLAARVRA